jgi:hypothetical protein
MTTVWVVTAEHERVVISTATNELWKINCWVYGGEKRIYGLGFTVISGFLDNRIHNWVQRCQKEFDCRKMNFEGRGTGSIPLGLKELDYRKMNFEVGWRWISKFLWVRFRVLVRYHGSWCLQLGRRILISDFSNFGDESVSIFNI